MVTRTSASPVAAGAWRATLVRSFRSAVALVAMINLVRGCYTGSGTFDKLNLVTANRSSLSGHFHNRLRKAFKERGERGHISRSTFKRSISLLSRRAGRDCRGPAHRNFHRGRALRL